MFKVRRLSLKLFLIFVLITGMTIGLLWRTDRVRKAAQLELLKNGFTIHGLGTITNIQTSLVP